MPAPVPPPSSADLTARQRRLILSGLMVAMFLAALDQTILGTALPQIAAELGSGNEISWVISAYLLAATVATSLVASVFLGVSAVALAIASLVVKDFYVPIFKPTPERFELVAQNQIGTDSFPSPAICGGQIFLRVGTASPEGRREMLYCFSQSK